MTKTNAIKIRIETTNMENYFWQVIENDIGFEIPKFIKFCLK